MLCKKLSIWSCKMKLIKSIKKKLTKINQRNRNMRKIDEIIRVISRTHELQSLAMNSDAPLVSDEKHVDPELIVSLTSYSKRIHDVHIAIESIGQQTIKPNRIILWLDHDEFSEGCIPLVLKRQQKRGLEIRFCENMRAHKKLIPTLNLCPEADVITIDDDIIYPHDMVELLVRQHKLTPGAIVGIRSHRIRLDDKGLMKPYKSWEHENSFKKNDQFTFLTTGAGTYFPHNLLPDEIQKIDQLNTLCPYSDDVWVNLLCIKYNVDRLKVQDDRIFKTRFLVMPENQDIALHKKNVAQHENDAQIRDVEKFYKIKLK